VSDRDQSETSTELEHPLPFELPAGPEEVSPGYAEAVLSRLEGCDPKTLWSGSALFQGLAQNWHGHSAARNEMKTAQMFCEVHLGQAFGPNPGQGARTDLGDFRNSESDIPAWCISEFRRYYGWRNQLIEAIRNGVRSRHGLLRKVDELEFSGDDVVELPEIRSGDFRQVLVDLEDDSVDLILTDPPYPAEFLPLWSDMAEFASRKLVPGGSLLAYSGQGNLPEVLTRLAEHLRYWWILSLDHAHGSQNLPGKFVTIGWKPIVWFVKGGRRDDGYVADQLTGSPPRKGSGAVPRWAQGCAELEPLIRSLTQPGQRIVDPFAGSGTVGHAALALGRTFIGAEIG
jgi:16S rRNA G966 N2-methylase RsmD